VCLECRTQFAKSVYGYKLNQRLHQGVAVGEFLEMQATPKELPQYVANEASVEEPAAQEETKPQKQEADPTDYFCPRTYMDDPAFARYKKSKSDLTGAAASYCSSNDAFQMLPSVNLTESSEHVGGFDITRGAGKA